MSWKGEVQKTPELIPEGTYKAIVSSISETDSKYGTAVRIEFTLATRDQFDGLTINGVCSTVIHSNSKFGMWLTAIIGELPGENEYITDDDILYKGCKIEVKHVPKKDDGAVFANVVNVLPLEETPPVDDDDVPFS